MCVRITCVPGIRPLIYGMIWMTLCSTRVSLTACFNFVVPPVISAMLPSDRRYMPLCKRLYSFAIVSRTSPLLCSTVSTPLVSTHNEREAANITLDRHISSQCQAATSSPIAKSLRLCEQWPLHNHQVAESPHPWRTFFSDRCLLRKSRPSIANKKQDS